MPTDQDVQEGVKIKWQVVGGDHDGETITQSTAITCTQQTRQRIGRAFMTSLCEAVGLCGTQDTDELLGREHVIKVEKKGEFTNVTNAYGSNRFEQLSGEVHPVSRSAAATPSAHQVSAAASAPAHTPTQQPTQQAQPTGKRPPWMK